jgi:hypothetical protein
LNGLLEVMLSKDAHYVLSVQENEPAGTLDRIPTYIAKRPAYFR